MGNEREKGAAADEWFAAQLGEGWRAAGRGIYEYVGEPAVVSEAEDALETPPAEEMEESGRQRRATPRRLSQRR